MTTVFYHALDTSLPNVVFNTRPCAEIQVKIFTTTSRNGALIRKIPSMYSIRERDWLKLVT